MIKEECLFDPENEGYGLFYELTDRERRKGLGLTGTAGFLLVRRRGGLEATPLLNRKIELPDTDRIDWHILVKNLTKDEIVYESLPNHPFEPGYLNNYLQVLEVLKSFEKEGFLPDELSAATFSGISISKFIEAVLLNGDNNSKDALSSLVSRYYPSQAVVDLWGLTPAHLPSGQIDAFDLMNVIQSQHDNLLLSPEYQYYLHGLMGRRSLEGSAVSSHLEQHYEDLLCYGPDDQTNYARDYAQVCTFSIRDNKYSLILHFSFKDSRYLTHEDINTSLLEFSNAFFEHFDGLNDID